MNARDIFKQPLLCGLLAGFLTAPLLAGTEVTVRSQDQQDIEQVEQAIDELELEAARATPAQDHALAVGQARSGARVVASVEHGSDGSCTLDPGAESAEDQGIEARFLRLMQTR